MKRGDYVWIKVRKEGYLEPDSRFVRADKRKIEEHFDLTPTVPMVVDEIKKEEKLVFFRGEWVKPEERGIVRHRGRWVDPYEEGLVMDENGNWIEPSTKKTVPAKPAAPTPVPESQRRTAAPPPPR